MFRAGSYAANGSATAAVVVVVGRILCFTRYMLADFSDFLYIFAGLVALTYILPD